MKQPSAYLLEILLWMSQELKALPEVLDSTPYGFALELALAASRREYLDLQQWLSDRFRQLALPFFQVGCRTCTCA